MRAIRIELLIATLALLASAAASIATVVQTRVVANQLSASVWPYLSFNLAASPGQIGVTVDNDGLGPALVRNVRLTIDGRQMTEWRRVLRLLILPKAGARKSAAHTHSGVDEQDVGFGTVIRPGATLDVIAVKNEALDYAFLNALKPRIDMQICYCSILGQCWVADLAAADQPKSVNDCGPKGPPLVY
jgi:hypothetical protein